MTDPHGDNEQERALVERFVATRGEAAFRDLYRRHTPALYGLAYRLTGGGLDNADDVVQETWLRAVRSIDGFRSESSLRTWLRAICFNVYRELLRKPGRHDVELDESRPQLRVVSGSGKTSPGLDLERAVATLSPGYREVLILHDVEGYTHKEIGKLVGIDEGTSKSQLSRARRALREALRTGPEQRRENAAGNEGERA